MIVLRRSGYSQREFVAASYKNHKQKKEADLRKAELKFKKAKKDSNKNLKEVFNIKPVINNKVDNNLANQAEKHKASVFEDKSNLLGYGKQNSILPGGDNSDFEQYAESKKRFHKENQKEIDNMISSSKKGNSIIRHPKNSGIESLAHEIGHIQAGDRKIGKTPLEDIKFTLKDERKASINAIGNLKKSGASNKEIKQSKSNLRTMENSYKFAKNRIRYGGKLGRDPNEG